MSQVYHYQNKEDHPGSSLSCGEVAKVSTNPEPEKLVCPERFILGKQRQTFPRTGGVSQERLHITPSPSWFKPDSYGEGQRSAYLAAS